MFFRTNLKKPQADARSLKNSPSYIFDGGLVFFLDHKPLFASDTDELMELGVYQYGDPAFARKVHSLKLEEENAAVRIAVLSELIKVQHLPPTELIEQLELRLRKIQETKINNPELNQAIDELGLAEPFLFDCYAKSDDIRETLGMPDKSATPVRPFLTAIATLFGQNPYHIQISDERRSLLIAGMDRAVERYNEALQDPRLKLTRVASTLNAPAIINRLNYGRNPETLVRT